MNKQEIRYRAKKRRAKALAKRRMVLLLATLLLITVGTILFGSCFSSLAKDNVSAANQEYKYYTSIEIQEGDSLWSIAEQYKSEHYESTQAYIDELVVLNDLRTETIHEGQHLMVVYYDSEFK